MLFQDFNKFILSLNYKEIGSQSAGFVMTLKLLSNKVRVTEIEAKLLSVLPIYFTVKITIFDLDDLNKYTCANIRFHKVHSTWAQFLIQQHFYQIMKQLL